MYRTQNITTGQLGQIAIYNQDQIVDLTGSKLNLAKVHEVIRTESKDFTKSSVKAQQADDLLADLLEKRGIDVPKPVDEPAQADDNYDWEQEQKAKAMQLELELLALEMELDI